MAIIHRKHAVTINGTTTYDLLQTEHQLAKTRSVKNENITKTKSKEERCQYPRLKKTVRIEPHKSEFLEVELKGQEGSIIAACPYHRHVQPGPGFIQTAADSKVHVPIFNTTKESQTM